MPRWDFLGCGKSGPLAAGHIEGIDRGVQLAIGLSASHIDDTCGKGCRHLVKSFGKAGQRLTTTTAILQHEHVTQGCLSIGSSTHADDTIGRDHTGSIGQGTRQLSHGNPTVRIGCREHKDIGIETLLPSAGSRGIGKAAPTCHDEPLAIHACKGSRHTLQTVTYSQLWQFLC